MFPKPSVHKSMEIYMVGSPLFSKTSVLPIFKKWFWTTSSYSLKRNLPNLYFIKLFSTTKPFHDMIIFGPTLNTCLLWWSYDCLGLIVLNSLFASESYNTTWVNHNSYKFTLHWPYQVRGNILQTLYSIFQNIWLSFLTPYNFIYSK
jgi:hypothetical protein